MKCQSWNAFCDSMTKIRREQEKLWKAITRTSKKEVR